MTQRIFKITSASFLVTGTCIGGGILGIPIISGFTGFFPSVIVITYCWIFMTITGLLFLEATLWMKRGSHIITISDRLLGRSGKIVSWIVYLFVSYASLVAYIAGGGQQIAVVLGRFLNIHLGNNNGECIFAILFCPVIYFGYKLTSRINFVFVIGMIVAYLGLLIFSISEIDINLVKRTNWDLKEMVSMVPLILAMFSYPGIVPTLVPHLNNNVKDLRISIVLGTTLSYVAYVVWQFVILGTIRYEGAHGLATAYEKGESLAKYLFFVHSNPWFAFMVQFFAFFFYNDIFFWNGSWSFRFSF